MSDFIDKRSLIVQEDGRLVVSDTPFLLTGRKYNMSCDRPFFITGRNEYGSYEFITNGSKQYFVPSSCNLRKLCQQNLIMHLPYHLGTRIETYDDTDIIEQWADQLDLTIEEIRNQIILYNKTEHRVMIYGKEWLLYLDGSDPYGGGKSDYIELINLEPNQKLVLIWGLSPWAEEGQGTTSVTFTHPHDNMVSTVYFWGFSEEKGHIDVRPSKPLLQRIDPQSVFSTWVVENYPTFIEMMQSWFYYVESGNSHFIRNLDEFFDVNSAPDDIISKIADIQIPNLPIDQSLIKRSFDLWSSKGSYDFARLALTLFGANPIDIWYPKEKILRLQHNGFVSKRYIYLVQLDRIDVNGHNSFIDRQPYDPSPFSSYEPDKINLIGDNGIVLVGIKSKTAINVKFDSWMDDGNGTRIAKLEVINFNGEPVSWERMRPSEDSGLSEEDIGYPHVVPVITRDFAVISSGSGHIIGEEISVNDARFEGKAVVSQTINGEIIKTSIIRPFIYVLDDNCHIRKVGTGTGAQLRSNISSFVIEDAEYLVDRPLQFDEYVIEGGQIYHPFSYVVRSRSPSYLWKDKFLRITHPAGHRLLVDYNVNISNNGCVATTGDFIIVNRTRDQLIRRNQCKYETAHKLDHTYWPNRPKLIADGQIIDQFETIYDPNDKSETLYVKERWKDIIVGNQVVKPIRYGWNASVSNCGVRNGAIETLFVERKSEVVNLSEGSFVLNRIDDPNYAADGSVIIYGDHSSMIDHDIGKWQKSTTTRIVDQKIKPVEWVVPVLLGTVSLNSAIEFETGDDFMVKMVFDRSNSGNDLKLHILNGQSRGIVFGIDIHNNVISMIRDDLVPEFVVSSFELTKIRNSSLREITVIGAMQADAEVLLQIDADSVPVPYVYLGQPVGKGVYPIHENEADSFDIVEVGPSRSAYLRLMVTPLGANPVSSSSKVPIITLYHPTYDFGIFYTHTNVEVWFENNKLHTVPINWRSGHIIEYQVDFDQSQFIMIDGERLNIPNDTYSPEYVKMGHDIKVIDFSVITSEEIDVTGVAK